MRSSIFLPLLAALALASPALATPPLRMDSTGVVRARALAAGDGGINTGTGVSELPGGTTGFALNAIAPPTPVVTSNTTLDGGGSTTYTYAIAACSSTTCAAGTESALGSTGSTTTSIATPTSTYPNLVTIPATVGAQAFAIWQTVPTGARMGLLAVVKQNTCSNAGDFCGATFLDTGAALVADLSPNLAGNGDAGPTVDLSGAVIAPAELVAGVRSIPTWATCTITSSTTCTATVPLGSHCNAGLSAVSDGGNVVASCAVSSTTATCTVPTNTTASLNLICD